jgi:protein-S-isoprenylcysteine O-methyltransferase Ste14
MACFAGAIPLYFRKGKGNGSGKTVMLLCIVVCGTAQAVAFVIAGDVAVWWRVAGLCVLAVAHLLFWAAVHSHGANRPRVAFAGEIPQRLVCCGPYRWVRHPFYLAYTLGWLAGPVMTASPWLAGTVVVMFLVYRSAAKAEEAAFLLSTLAQDYKDYQHSTGMFIPKLSVGIGRHHPRKREYSSLGLKQTLTAKSDCQVCDHAALSSPTLRSERGQCIDH